MSTALAPTDSRLKTFKQHLNSELKALEVLLPEGMKSTTFARIVTNAVQASPGLVSVDRGSLMMAILNCAALGLEPNTPNHEAVIIPRAGEATLQIEYRGILELARRGGVEDLYAGTIREGDEWGAEYGSHKQFFHKPLLPPNLDRPPMLYYAYVLFESGSEHFLVWSRQQVEAHRDQYSDSYNKAERTGKKDSAWHTAFDRMAEKTMIHQMERWLPKKAREAIEVQRAYDSGRHVETTEGGVLTIGDGPAEPEPEPEEAIDVPTETEAQAQKARESKAKAKPKPAEKKLDAKPDAEDEEPAGDDDLAGAAPDDAPVGDIDGQGYVNYKNKVRHIVTFTERTRSDRSTKTDECNACGEEIVAGETYYDAGPRCHVHTECGVKLSQLVLGKDGDKPAPEKEPEKKKGAPEAEVYTIDEAAEELAADVDMLKLIFRNHRQMPHVEDEDGRVRFTEDSLAFFEEHLEEYLAAEPDEEPEAEEEEPEEAAPEADDDEDTIAGMQKLEILEAAMGEGGIGVNALMTKIGMHNPNWTELGHVPARMYDELMTIAKGG